MEPLKDTSSISRCQLIPRLSQPSTVVDFTLVTQFIPLLTSPISAVTFSLATLATLCICKKLKFTFRLPLELLCHVTFDSFDSPTMALTIKYSL